MSSKGGPTFKKNFKLFLAIYCVLDIFVYVLFLIHMNRRFLICSRDYLSLVIPNINTLEHKRLKVTLIVMLEAFKGMLGVRR